MACCRYLFFLFFLFITWFQIVNSTHVDLSRGFGSEIDWMTMEDAFSGEDQKPFFILIHKTWCGACQNLKESLKESFKFKELSEYFYMINLEDDEEPKEEMYSPDGSYIPRLLFLDHNKNVRDELINEHGNPKYKYFYSAADQVIKSMEKAIEVLYDEIENDENEENDYEDLEHLTPDEAVMEDLLNATGNETTEENTHDEF